uniref:Uncharacterized protein n=1 Tax=Solanum lycopersicum TaxID=4081 RepID=A0A3Q7IG71_SOLLC
MAATMKRFIYTTVNVGTKVILDGFRVQSRVVIEKEVVAATRSNATTRLTHGFITSLHPCFLASSKPLPEETEIDMIEDDNGVSGGCWIQITVHVPGKCFLEKHYECRGWKVRCGVMEME